MKNIIVGIDFSNNSLNVLRHANAIALKTAATLHIVWVKTPGITKNLLKDNVDDIVKISNDILDNLVKQSKKEAVHSEIQRVILEGRPFVELTNYAANLKNSMIAIGSHGISGFEERFVGSNTHKTVSESTVPILVLRENIIINRDLIEILVPLDTSFETLQKVRPAIEFAKAFSAKIRLTGFYADQNKQEEYIVDIQLTHAENMCLDANVRYEISSIPYKNNISETIIEHLKTNDVNLMVIMRENDENATASLSILSHTTQKLLNSSPVPLLIVPNKNLLSISK